MTFSVIDNKTGKIADVEDIALKEEWAKELIYCDMEGFAIEEDGSLVLLDECGGVAYCPDGRFTIVFDEEQNNRKQSEGKWIDKPTGAYGRMQSWCSACGKHSGIGGIESNRHKPFCPNCGAKMKGGAEE